MAPKSKASPRGRSSSQGRAPAAKAKSASKAAPAPKAAPARKATPAATEEAAPPPGEAPETGQCSVEEAGALLKELQPADFVELAASTDEAEQLPARVALEYVGDRDLSWANARKSLAAGADFLREIFEMGGDRSLTRGGLGRIEELGRLDPSALEGKSKAAHRLALYLSACIRSAEKRLGLIVEPEVAAPLPDEPPPEWPMIVPFTELSQRIAEAAKWRKTALIVGNGHAKEVDTFLQYRAFITIQAKRVLGETTIRKKMSVDEMREELRCRLVSAMRNGQPLHIAMENTAVKFKEQFCEETTFPAKIFDYGAFDDLSQPEGDREYKKVIREIDVQSWEGAFPGRAKDGFFVVVTTDFGVESACDYLRGALPYFESMAVIEIDPTSFA